jgi:hypothetical protein
MRPEALVRGVAKGIVVFCLAGGVVAADCHDWPDTMLIGLLGAFSVVTARKMTWKLRLARDANPTYPASPDLASSSRVSPAAPISSSCNSNHTV